MCLNCGKEITSKYGTKFCSHNCSATYTNKNRKKYVVATCDLCGKGLRYPLPCKACEKSKNQPKTIGDIKRLYHNKSSLAIAAKIRGYSRYIYMKSDKPKHCIKCGYSLYIEVCHIKPVSSFEDADLLADVNALSNLVALCRNCHWEFDKGYINVD